MMRLLIETRPSLANPRPSMPTTSKHPALSERQSAILTALIERYVREARPVSSTELVRAADLDVSPATMRNELKVLEEAGMVMSPHTSAGRIPTDAGYRFYVSDLLRQPAVVDHGVKPAEVADLKKKMHAMEQQMEAQTKLLARLLAELTKDMGIMIDGPNHVEPAGFSHLLEKQEFQNPEQALALATIVDEPETFWKSISARTAGSDDVQVFIGPEAGLRSVDAALIVAPYHTQAGEQGAIAVLGSTRMNYARNVSVVRMIAQLLSTGALGAMAILVAPGLVRMTGMGA